MDKNFVKKKIKAMLSEAKEAAQDKKENQITDVEIILRNNDLINHAGIVRRLYNIKDKKKLAGKTSLFARKLYNEDGEHFNEDELSKISAILKNLTSDIRGN